MKEEIVKFTNWIKLKIKLHLGGDINFYFKEREIWWASIGANVGIDETRLTAGPSELPKKPYCPKYIK
jgi:hypothetical protein